MEMGVRLGDVLLQVVLVGCDFRSQFFLLAIVVGDQCNCPGQDMCRHVKIRKEHLIDGMGDLVTVSEELSGKTGFLACSIVTFPCSYSSK